MSNPRAFLAKRRDENEPDVILALERAGCTVLKADVVDLIVGLRGQTFILEVKVPGKDRPSKLRQSQRDILATWRGQYAIVTTPLEALKAVGVLPA